MQFPKGSGLEFLDRTVRRSLNYYADLLKSDKISQSIFNPTKEIPPLTLPKLDDLRKPVESLLKSLNKTVSQFTAKPERVDYHAVVNSFLPPGAKLLNAQFPAGEIQSADVDSDKRSELIASYRTMEGIRTIVLKKDEVQWFKMAEISTPDYDEVHYRGVADMAGDGKKYLLLGLVSRQRIRTLFAYSMTDGGAKKIFSKNYSKLDLQKSRDTAGAVKDVIAVWNENSPGIYDIELVRWNGIDLERMNSNRYLSSKVVPYYIGQLRQNPNSVADWYNLADSLSRSGDRASALRAVNLGLGHNPDTYLKERFNALKSKL
ncbi:MAG TPA: hypothetical protein VHT96_17885 [Clostridia bacterium]|nr:hypothetical protein [Clostridia bacterium]